MALLPNRHPNRDFFAIELADVVPKSDTASMEHPIFSLSTKPDMRKLNYSNGNNTLEIFPSAIGLPTVFDKDLLIYCISYIIHRKKLGLPTSKTVVFTAHDFLIATNRLTNNHAYNSLESTITRLRGTTLKTNISIEDEKELKVFGFIDSGGFVEKTKDGKARLNRVEITLSDFTYSAIENMKVLTIDTDYFRLRKPLERRLYEIARKHCGTQKRWQIKLEKLQKKTGSIAPLKRFRHNFRKIADEGDTPDYTFELDENDLVTVRPRKPEPDYSVSLQIKLDTEEKARKICREKNLDYFSMECDWREFARSQIAKGMPPKSADGSFIGWLKKQEPNARISY